jgi:hypothetical protein
MKRVAGAALQGVVLGEQIGAVLGTVAQIIGAAQEAAL